MYIYYILFTVFWNIVYTLFDCDLPIGIFGEITNLLQTSLTLSMTLIVTMTLIF